MWRVSSAWIPSDDRDYYKRNQKPSDVLSDGWWETLW